MGEKILDPLWPTGRNINSNKCFKTEQIDDADASLFCSSKFATQLLAPVQVTL